MWYLVDSGQGKAIGQAGGLEGRIAWPAVQDYIVGLTYNIYYGGINENPDTYNFRLVAAIYDPSGLIIGSGEKQQTLTKSQQMSLTIQLTPLAEGAYTTSAEFYVWI